MIPCAKLTISVQFLFWGYSIFLSCLSGWCETKNQRKAKEYTLKVICELVLIQLMKLNLCNNAITLILKLLEHLVISFLKLKKSGNWIVHVFCAYKKQAHTSF